MLQDVALHLQRHVVHVMVRRVVHDGILKHQHDVALELSGGTDNTGLDVLLYGRQVHGSAARKQQQLVCFGTVVEQLGCNDF